MTVEAPGKPLRILHVFDHSLPLHSGYSFRSAAILREQNRLGWNTLQVTGPKHKSRLAEEQIEGLCYHRTKHTVRGLERVPLAGQVDVIMALRLRLDSIVREFRPNVIHAHSPCLNGIAAAAVARRYALPFVYEMRASWEDAAVTHGTTAEGGLRYQMSRSLETRVLRSARAVTTICEGLRRDIVSRGVGGNRVFVVPNAVDLEHFAPVGPADSALRTRFRREAAPMIGFIGSFYAYEGLDLLLKAMPMICARHPAAHLLLVGGGPEESRLQALARELGVTGAVSFAGRVPQEKIPAYYGIMDIMVYPRRRTRLTELVTPLKPLEAMAQRRLVAASDVGGHRELVKHLDTGLLFAADDPSAICATVELASAGQRTAEICDRARLYVEQERTWDRVTTAYQSAYAAVLPGGERAPVLAA
jgi:PEP-CTERM/exosortase A-associated glycosyltransferase